MKTSEFSIKDITDRWNSELSDDGIDDQFGPLSNGDGRDRRNLPSRAATADLSEFSGSATTFERKEGDRCGCGCDWDSCFGFGSKSSSSSLTFDLSGVGRTKGFSPGSILFRRNEHADETMSGTGLSGVHRMSSGTPRTDDVNGASGDGGDDEDMPIRFFFLFLVLLFFFFVGKMTHEHP